MWENQAFKGRVITTSYLHKVQIKTMMVYQEHSDQDSTTKSIKELIATEASHWNKPLWGGQKSSTPEDNWDAIMASS